MGSLYTKNHIQSHMITMKNSGFAVALLVAFYFDNAHAQALFDPPAYENKLRVTAHEAKGTISIDGNLTEEEWAVAPVAKNFKQSRPDQGKDATVNTEVRILYDEENIYISAVCYEPLGKNGINVQDLRRDFSYSQNELFSVTFDPFQDVRNPMPTFQISPYGNQRDLLIYDDRVFDTDWDAVWEAHCTITDSAWIAEIAIPWSSLRYPSGQAEWGINFNRNSRRLNEHTGWSLWPRAYTVGRMQYAGLLQNIQPPDPKLNMRLLPYLLFNEVRNNDENSSARSSQVKAGGELKWAVTPNTVIDLTVNTDFAQADVDRQVINLTRSNIFFPERRPFFLENASLFAVGEDGILQPFFSRAIGLSADGSPVPITAGGRVIHQNSHQSYGVLAVAQDGVDTIRNSQFGVARYLKNIGANLRIGGLINYRRDNFVRGRNNQNAVGAADVFYRISQPLYFRSMISVSRDDAYGEGVAFFGNINYTKNWIAADWRQAVVTGTYTSGVGFSARQNFIHTNPSVDFFIQKNWLPKKIWNLNPGISANVYHQADNENLQEVNVLITPVKIVFRSLASLGFRINPTRQNLSSPFNPVKEITFGAGDYSYMRYELFGETNQSAKYSIQLQAGTGGYFSGRLDHITVMTRFAPIPHIAVSVTYSTNHFRTEESSEQEIYTHLFAPEIRLAFNPLIQFAAFYQHNTAADRGSLNARFSWQYKPLSFIYIVYNENQSLNLTPDLPAYRQQSGIIKLSYIKQF